MAQRVAVVDASINNYSDIVASLDGSIQVLIIDSTANGWSKLAEKLTGYSGIDTLDIFSHGAEGRVVLGGQTIDGASLDTHSELLASIGSHLADGADVMLYGCSVGAGSLGSQFVSQFAEAVGADVAASDDLTGSAALGGDWVLEVQSGRLHEANPIRRAKRKGLNRPTNPPRCHWNRSTKPVWAS